MSQISLSKDDAIEFFRDAENNFQTLWRESKFISNFERIVTSKEYGLEATKRKNYIYMLDKLLKLGVKRKPDPNRNGKFSIEAPSDFLNKRSLRKSTLDLTVSPSSTRKKRSLEKDTDDLPSKILKAAGKDTDENMEPMVLEKEKSFEDSLQLFNDFTSLLSKIEGNEGCATLISNFLEGHQMKLLQKIVTPTLINQDDGKGALLREIETQPSVRDESNVPLPKSNSTSLVNMTRFEKTIAAVSKVENVVSLVSQLSQEEIHNVQSQLTPEQKKCLQQLCGFDPLNQYIPIVESIKETTARSPFFQLIKLHFINYIYRKLTGL